ncbi:hypothetical protein [Flavobacterium praedii]|uniref:hypothetical protein n=1 Tax=Flavobacterium praedii TaxID=3002900 RepID=UPI002481CF27|nr:hypothetical protein [Flavobacterium praedii]
MRLEIKSLAKSNYKKFCELEGCDYIASEFALESLLRIMECFKIKSILEVGMGIGSVSDTILKYVASRNLSVCYHGTENNGFCLKALPQNVTLYNQVNVFFGLNSLTDRKYDLIIIDGSDESLIKLLDICSENAIVFIEGGRQEQTKMVLNLFPKSLHVNVITLKKNPSYAHEGRSSKSYIGGGQLIFVNPTYKMRLYWFNKKVLTFFKIRIRKINR